MTTPTSLKKEIVDYYDRCEVAYKDVWDLEKSMAMHYGYWDAGVNNLRQALRRLNEVLAERAKISKEDHVLDAGCGVGGSSIFLAGKFGCKTTGISLSEKQISSAKENSKNSGTDHLTNFHQADYTNTHFEDESFDVVWAVESVCHAENKEDFIREAWRILKKGGRLIMSDGFYSKQNHSVSEREILHRWVRNWAIDDLETIENMCKYAQATGFENICSEDLTPYILRSSKKLHFYANLAMTYGNLLRFFGKEWGDTLRIKNTVGTIYQYKAIKKGLWKYCIFYAEKP